MITPSTTHQQTQMIVDSVEGTYQNTLTIAQSVTGDNLYGLYSCMVENSRGSSNKTVYFYGKSFIIVLLWMNKTIAKINVMVITSINSNISTSVEITFLLRKQTIRFSTRWLKHLEHRYSWENKSTNTCVFTYSASFLKAVTFVP